MNSVRNMLTGLLLRNKSQMAVKSGLTSECYLFLFTVIIL